MWEIIQIVISFRLKYFSIGQDTGEFLEGIFMSKNEILNVEGDSQKLEIRTSEGLITIAEDEITQITKGIIPFGLKDKKELADISSKTLKKEITKVLSRKQKEEKNEDQVIFKTRFTFKGTHYAEIKIDRTTDREFGTYQFVAYGDDKGIRYLKEVETYDDDRKKIIIRPAPQIAQQKLDRIFENDSFEFLKFPPDL